MTPMRRHLTAARRGIVRRADRLLKHLVRSDAECQAQGTVPILQEKPMVSRPPRQAGSALYRLVPRPADLEKDAILPLECDLAVIEAPRELHRPESADQDVGIESLEAVVGGRLGGRRGH